MNDPITITLPSGMQAGVNLPAYAVAYAIVDANFEPGTEIASPQLSDGPTSSVDGAEMPVRPLNGERYRFFVALKTAPEATYYAAYHRARAQFPNLDWVKVPSVRNCASTRGAAGGYYDVTFEYDQASGRFYMCVPANDPMLSAYRGFSDRSSVEVDGTDDLQGIMAALASGELRGAKRLRRS